MNNSIATRLRSIRQERGLSTYQLAELTGIRQPNIVRAERGEGLSLTTLTRLAEALGYEVGLVAKTEN